MKKLIFKIGQFPHLSKDFIITQMVTSSKLGYEKNNSFQTPFGISFLRILATLSVIVIHVSGPLVVKFGEISSFDWNVANFFDSISRYSVPVFFMISGSLLLGQDYGFIEFLKKRLGKILPPFLFWSLMYSILNRYVFSSEIFNVSKVVKDMFYGSEYHLWFIYTLIGVYLFTPILQKWIKNALQKEILYVLIIWILTLIIDIPGLKIYFPRIDFSYFSGFLGYFVLGYYLKQYSAKEKLIPVLFVILGVLITILGTYIFTVKNAKFYYYFYEYLNLNTLMVSSGVFLLFKKMEISNKKINSIVINLNQCCFGIYLIHPLVLKLFKLSGLDVYVLSPVVSILIVSIVCFLLCFFIISCLKKLKYGYLIS
jgi:surface polysaccharide O-acyltransferase-like enzyme